MKREHVDDKHHHSNPMFANLHHQTHKFHHPQPPPQPPLLHHHHPFATNPTTECPTSQEADSHTTTHPNKKNSKDHHLTPMLLTPPPPPVPAPSNDGATIEVVRRQRGRPPGSKNKPKPPLIITRDSSESSMSPYVLELPPGIDVIEATTRFCRKRNTGLCVLNGNGAVSNVTLKQPSTTPGPTVTFHGRFDILSLSATILPPGVLSGGLADGFTISLAGPQGQMVGGCVVGPLVSAGTIYLIATSFNSPSYHRLQMDDNDGGRDSSGGGGDSGAAEVSGGGDSGAAAAESGGGSMYSYQASDVIWAPTARQAQQPPPY